MLHIATVLTLVTGAALVGTFPALGLIALPPVPAILSLPALGIGLLRARRARARARVR